ncbi:MULE domain-containing protein [Aphis craccivora]|uniref:MULE domain-containing protein n=1 Tax=Aphis craccivora TaxID=307492 RepID=A0A6G0ZI76_APHCR|nr:MULE domain-containing protein [Aphis craccivora]
MANIIDIEVSLKYIKNERGSNILVDEGFIVQKKIWRCYHVIGDIDNEKFSKKIDHNHVPDITQIEVKTAITLASQVSASVAGQLPNVLTLKTVQRVRQSHLGALINPENFNFEISDRFTKSTNGEQFLPFDNKSETNRILLFISADLPRTNNSVEGWHNCFSAMLNSSSHPTMWKFINAFQKEEQVNRMKIEQYVAGMEPPSKKITIENYLRKIAHNIQIQI